MLGTRFRPGGFRVFLIGPVSHLIRDFTAALGMPPAAYVRLNGRPERVSATSGADTPDL